MPKKKKKSVTRRTNNHNVADPGGLITRKLPKTPKKSTNKKRYGK